MTPASTSAGTARSSGRYQVTGSSLFAGRTPSVRRPTYQIVPPPTEMPAQVRAMKIAANTTGAMPFPLRASPLSRAITPKIAATTERPPPRMSPMNSGMGMSTRPARPNQKAAQALGLERRSTGEVMLQYLASTAVFADSWHHRPGRSERHGEGHVSMTSPSEVRDAAPSAWAPLAITAFRVLWFAQLGSNIGTWMQTVGAQWYLVEAAAGAAIIALVQTASL